LLSPLVHRSTMTRLLCVMALSLCSLSLCALVLQEDALSTAVTAAAPSLRGAVAASDSSFQYQGRWKISPNGDATTDWPCASVHFKLVVGAGGGGADVEWEGLRDRMNISVTNAETGEFYTDLLTGAVTWPTRHVDTVQGQNPSTFIVSIRKLTTAAPFGMGIGGEVLSPSTFTFHGLKRTFGNCTLEAVPAPSRSMEFIGASDTAGYCVDGTPDMSGTTTDLLGWEYENCDMAYPGRLGAHFNAAVSVEAISGIGLTQNANAKQKWQLGSDTMHVYWNRTLQTEKDNPWDFSRAVPDVVLISLGGNDFNHQDGNVPSNQSFAESYEAFVLRVFQVYGNITVVSVCGMGTPEETKQDPDNNRCRPCPHVESAVSQFTAKYAHRLRYVFIPCDGSAASGNSDIGCRGHKNVIGQAEIANYLIPHITAIMNWTAM